MAYTYLPNSVILTYVSLKEISVISLHFWTFIHKYPITLFQKFRDRSNEVHLGVKGTPESSHRGSRRNWT